MIPIRAAAAGLLVLSTMAAVPRTQHVSAARAVHPRAQTSLYARSVVSARTHRDRAKVQQPPGNTERHPRRLATAIGDWRRLEAMAALGTVFDTADAWGEWQVKKAYDCKLTAYGPGFASTGKRPGDPGYGVTASGHLALPRHTVAVDPKWIPLGSLVYIDGVGYRVAEDVGGAIRGPHIDLFFPSDDQAKQFGVRRHVRVFVFAQEPHALRSRTSL